MKINLEKEIFKYDIAIEPVSKKTPALKNRRKRRQLYKILFEETDFQRLGEGVATDYATTLITCGRLFDKARPDKTYELIYRSESELRDEDGGTQPDERKYEVTVKFSSMVPSSELIRYVESQPNDPSDFTGRLDAIQAMNIIVAGGPNKEDGIFQAGQNKFFRYPRGTPDRMFSPVYDNIDLGDGLIAVRGYFSSVRTSTSRILLNLNAQCSAFYPEIDLLSLMRGFAGGLRIPPGKRSDLEAFIRKLRVTTEQLTREGKTVTREKTIWGFSHRYNASSNKGTKGADYDYGTSKTITFLCDIYSPPKKVSVNDYFQRREFFSSIQ